MDWSVKLNGKSSSDWKGFIAQCDDLLTDIADLPDRCSAKEDWENMVDDWKGWSEDHQHVTEKMENALDRVREGVEKWL